MSKGFIPIDRGLFEHHLWCEERCYSRFEAWLYLLKEARIEDAKLYLSSSVFVVKRGQISVSLRYLANHFQWSTKKVKTFIELLKSDGMISIETPKETGQTLITISNFDTYNKRSTRKETPKETVRKQQGNSEETNIIGKNNVNNENNESIGEIAYCAPSIDFVNFQSWINGNAPAVAKMSEPFTKAQFLKIKDAYPSDFVAQLLIAMHNWKPLVKKNQSAYLTFVQWAKNEKGEKNESKFNRNGVVSNSKDDYETVL